MKKIPITILLKGNPTEFNRDLFGLGEKVSNSKLPRELDSDELRYVNKEVKVDEGIIFSLDDNKKLKISESLDVGYSELFYVLGIATTGLGLAEYCFKFTNWLIDRTHKHDFKTIVNGKELKNKEEIKKALEDILKDED